MSNKKSGVGLEAMILKEKKVLLGKRKDDSRKVDSELCGKGAWTMTGGNFDLLGEN